MLLRARARERDIFTNGDYNPVDVQGARRDHVFAFARTAGGRRLVVAVPRLVATIAPQADTAPIGERVWGDTLIVPPFSAGRNGLHNVITDRCVAVEPG